MKNLTYLITVLFISLFLSCNTSNKEEKEEIKKEYPGEWMYNQRAYPNATINQKAVKKGIEQTKQALAQKRLSDQSWELVGPINIGGRITDIAISPENDDHFYFSTPNGGVFKTTDRGLNWTPIFDNIGRPSVGNIEIAPSDANRIYLGTGEANGSATSGAFFGDGMWKSDNAGDTWEHIGLEETQHIGRIVVDPVDKNRVFVAATGTLYGKNEERGVYRTTNAGSSWEKVLYVSDSTAVIDVAMNPVNTNILFAATWERTRKAWARDYGGETSGVYRSLDGGDSWVKLGNGLPVSDTETGRIGLAISESNPNIVYASYTTSSITNTFDGLYKSMDNGDNWELVALADIADVNAGFGWYFGNVRVHPENPNVVYVMGQKLYKTNDSGSNWNIDYYMHVDHHALEFSKTNSNLVLSGNDGGLYISETGGGTWTHFENLPITQFYNIEVDYSNPNRLFGGAQDNNTLRTTTGSDNDWHAILGGDGFQVNVDSNNSNNVYFEYQWGNLFRSTDGGNSAIWALDGINPEDRKNWNTPVEISPFDTNVLYYGTNKLYKSDNNAIYWSSISEDLTSGLHESGSLSYGNLTCIAPSYNNLDVVYVGSDDGNVSVTFNGGATWQSIDADLPNRFVTQISIHPNDDLVAYVTFSGFTDLDYTPHIFKTTDGGLSWEDISSNLPNVPINDVLVIASNDYLYVATDTAVWYSVNQGELWEVLGNNLQIGIIPDIKIHEPTNTLYAGTFGRSMYRINLDHLTSVNKLNMPVESLFSVFPNPIKTEFTIKLDKNIAGEVHVFITDIQGKIVQDFGQYNFENTDQKQNFNLQKINAGIYTIHIKSDVNYASKKIIIK